MTNKRPPARIATEVSLRERLAEVYEKADDLDEWDRQAAGANRRKLNQLRQSQAPLVDQLKALVGLANENGLYDAADYLKGVVDGGR